VKATRAARQKLWNDLPGIFGLGTWNKLLAEVAGGYSRFVQRLTASIQASIWMSLHIFCVVLIFTEINHCQSPNRLDAGQALKAVGSGTPAVRTQGLLHFGRNAFVSNQRHHRSMGDKQEGFARRGSTAKTDNMILHTSSH
jgi:hypothetical protein